MLATLGQAYSSYSSSPQSGPQGNGVFLWLGLLIVMFLVSLVIWIGICVLLHIIQSRVPAEHQNISPGMIWLMLIPLFGLVWIFFVFQRIPDSYQSYFDSVGDQSVGDCGKGVGLWCAICTACSIVPCLNYIAGPAALVLLIIFMVKLFGLRGKIPQAV